MNKSIRTIILLAVLALSFSCQKDDDGPTKVCDVTDPAENLPWMKAEIESWKSGDLYKYYFIKEGTYQDQTVFLILNCCPFCDTTIPVLNCQGEVLWYAPMDPDKTSKITNLKVVWKAPGSECTI